MKKTSPEIREVIWPFDDEIKASGLLRARDYGHAALLIRRSQIRTPLLVVALVLFAIFVFLAYFAAIQESWTWSSVVIITLPFIAVYLVLIHPYISSWRFVSRFRASGVEPETWTFSQQGIQFENDQSDSRFKWSLVTKVIVTKRYVLLQLGGGLYYTFALPVFDSNMSWRNFRIGIIRNFIGCRGCKYDLYGTDSDTCPECGHEIDDSR